MKKIYSLFLSFLLFCVFSQKVSGLDVSGSVNTNTTWGPEQVNVTGDVFISASVTIAAGTRIVVSDQVQIRVYSTGSIFAGGTATNEIVFTAANPSVGWRGIFFDSTADLDASSSFEYTQFEYGKADGSIASENSGGAVSISYHSDISFVNCTFDNNQASTYGGAINSAYSQLVLENCVFKSNQAGGSNGGGAVHIVNSDGNELKIENCSFFNNYAHTGGAIHAEFAEGLVVSGCVFANNEANFGSALTISQSSSNNISFISNTIVNNLANNTSGAVIRVTSYVENMLLANNIFSGNEDGSGNSSAITFDSDPNAPVFSNCLIEGGLASISGLPIDYTWTGMKDANPEFEAPSGGIGLSTDGSSANWQLSNQSPCINAGTEDVTGLDLPLFDLAGNDRIQQGRLDMGALESGFIPTAIGAIKDDLDFKIRYNREGGQIVVSTMSMTRFTGALYNITGALVVDKRSSNFQNQMIFPAAGLRNGIYVITLFGENGKALTVSKIVVN